MKNVTWIFQEKGETATNYVAKITVPASSALSSLNGIILNPAGGWGEKTEPTDTAKYPTAAETTPEEPEE